MWSTRGTIDVVVWACAPDRAAAAKRAERATVDMVGETETKVGGLVGREVGNNALEEKDGREDGLATKASTLLHIPSPLRSFQTQTAPTGRASHRSAILGSTRRSLFHNWLEAEGGHAKGLASTRSRPQKRSRWASLTT